MFVCAGKSRLIVAAAGAILAAGYVLAATELRMPAFSDPMGPRVVPYMIGAGLLLSSLALVVEHAASHRPKHSWKVDVDTPLPTITLLTLGLLAVYYVVFDYLGFILATALLLLALLSMTNRGRWATNIALSVAFPIGAYLLLATLLGAKLPLGLIQFGQG
jgi:putative tricarboxylic transport membrane protein